MLKQNKFIERKLQKICGFLFSVPATRNIYIEKIVEYTIFPKPPHPYHPDRSMYQTDKSAVLIIW